MNCEPGDLAIVVRERCRTCVCVECQIFRAMLGKIVRVTRLLGSADWAIEERVPVAVEIAAGFTITVSVTGMPDEYLIPIPALPVDAEQHDEVMA